MSPYRKSIVLLLTTLVVYGVLTATHLGEFWPFSIYPMFSQAGQPWSRAAVRDVTDDSLSSWQPVSLEELPGEPFATRPRGLDHTDLANFVSKTENWNVGRVAGLQRMFYDQLDGGRRLLVMRANGRLDEADSVVVEFVPYVLLDAQGATLNPALTE